MEIDPRLTLFTGDTGGIDSWLTSDNSDLIHQRLSKLQAEPVSHSLFNQLLGLSELPPVSRAYFEYYWCSTPKHPYAVQDLPGYDPSYSKYDRILCIDQLAWGLYRVYVDCLLYIGTLKKGFDVLREKDAQGLASFFGSKMYDPDGLASRGEPISPITIPIDDRYLIIGELACKSFEPAARTETYGT